MRVLLLIAPLLPALALAPAAQAHAAGYAWHTWLSNGDDGPATWHTLLDQCVDGVMTARPTAFEEMLRAHHIPEACG
jgi:glycerophosphoryl diester phosphodiesterase